MPNSPKDSNELFPPSDQEPPPVEERPNLPLDFNEPPPIPPSPRLLSSGWIILIIIASGIFVWLFGWAQRNSSTSPATQTGSSQSKVMVLLGVHDDVALLGQESADINHIVVVKPNQNSWLVVSGDDNSTSGASLSPDGAKVAYISDREDGQVAIISIISDTRQTISASQIQAAGIAAAIDDLKICEWSNTAWDPSSSRVAFFGCDGKRPLSVALISSLAASDITPRVVLGSSASFTNTRDIGWMNLSQIVVTTPTTGTQMAVNFLTP